MDEAFWMLRCNLLASHTQQMGMNCSPRMARLMVDAVQRFLALPTPTNPQLLSLREAQSWVVTGIVASVAHADQMGRTVPRAADELYDVTKSMSERPLPATRDLCSRASSEGFVFMSEVSSICNRHRLKQN